MVAANSLLLLLLPCFICFQTTKALQFDIMNISAIHEHLVKQDVNCTDVVDYFLHRAYKYNPMLKAIINFNPNAISEALMLDEYYHKNKKLSGRLHCIPVLVKDNIAVQGMPTTGGIKAMRHSIPNTDAYVVERLRDEGAIMIAKANLAELAFSEYNSETGGSCMNPWDLTRSCSRSSSGSGCGIAAGLAVISLGTDTDGSIMGPASYNGVFGLRPLHGETNNDGVIVLIESDDTIGPFSHHLDDLVLTYSIMINNETLYSNYKSSHIVEPKALRIGYIKNFLTPFVISITGDDFIYRMDDEVTHVFHKTVENFKKLNIQVFELEVPKESFDEVAIELKDIFLARFFGCSLKCLKQPLDIYFGNKKRFSEDSPYHSFEDIKNSPLLSDFFHDFFNNTYVTTCSESCKAYVELRKRFTQRVEAWYKLVRPSVDALIFPTSVITPEVLGDQSAANLLSATFIAAFTGYSSLNIPVQFSKITPSAPKGLPIGMMLVSPQESFINMLKAANLYEEAYLRDKKLPKSVPILQEEICLVPNKAKRQQYSNLVFILFLTIVIVVNEKIYNA